MDQVNPEGAPAPVETTVQPTAPPDGAPVEAVKPADPQPEPTEAKPRPTYGERIKELTDDKKELRSEVNYWREQYQRATQAGNQPPPQVPQAPPPKRTLEDFKYNTEEYAKYLRADAENEAANAVIEKMRKADQEKAEKQALKTFNARAKEYAKSVEDYHEVAGHSPISDDVAHMVIRMDDGPEVAYYLGKNHDIAERISELPPQLAAMELGRIAARLDIERQKISQKPVSQAPPPPPKIDAQDPSPKAKSTSDPESDKLTDKEWFALAEKERLKKRKGE